MTDLSTLLSRVESGSGADRGLDTAIERAFFGDAPAIEGWLGTLEYTTDLNAVVALVEARLRRFDGWDWTLSTRGAATYWAAIEHGGPFGVVVEGVAPTPARALLAALIRAEMEKVK